jgi:hypothetical protein
VLRRPHDLRRDAGEKVDEHTAGGGGHDADDDRGEHPQVVLEPFGKETVVYLPLVLTMIPLEELMKKLIGVLL